MTGSNSVNVFLGLGLPWVIATHWSASSMRADKGPNEWNAISQTKFELRFKKTAPGLTEELPLYYVPAGSLGFSVVVFICVACTCVVILLIRRAVV